MHLTQTFKSGKKEISKNSKRKVPDTFKEMFY